MKNLDSVCKRSSLSASVANPPTLMKPLKTWAAAATLIAAAGLCTAQTTDAQVQHEALLTLHYFGKGYAQAQLDGALLDLKTDKPRPLKLPAGEISLIGTTRERNLTVSGLKLTRGDFRELGLQIGETRTEALIRSYGKPEKQDDRRLVYRGIAEICVDHVIFHVAQGVLQGIEWDWCYD